MFFRKVRNEVKSAMLMSNQTVNAEKVIVLLDSIAAGNCDSVGEDYFRNAELTAAWNKMVNSISEERRTTLLKVNDLLTFNTDMDFIKKMIDGVKHQNQSLHSMAASSEEMTASIDDVSDRSQNASLKVSDTVNMAMEGSSQIEEAFRFVQKSFTDIKDVNLSINELISNMRQIEEIIDFIKGIAEQTNLLALNAAIEAARAGEQGKGFAVVAGEVRNLAEHTKSSVLDIQKNIIELKNRVEHVVAKTNSTSSGLDKGRMLVDKALKSIESIINSISTVNNEVLQIASNTEEQSAVSEEFAQKTGDISEAADELMRDCDKTGRAIFKLSQLSNSLRLSLIKNSSCLGDMEMLEICKADHLIWRWRVYNMLLGYETIDIGTIGTHKECRLGQWYYHQGKEKHGTNQVFCDMEQPHMRLHELAKEAAIAYSKGDILSAEHALELMDQCSAQVVSSLDKLKG